MISRRSVVMLFVTLGLLFGGVSLAEVEHFDHAAHLKKVFGPNQVDCASCHAFSVDPLTGRASDSGMLSQGTLRRPVKEICHECHRSAEMKWAAAPKACTTCHRSMERLTNVMPPDHRGVGWKTSHSTMARVQGDTCQNCHMVSQCTKCHLRRNEEEFSNHSLNFRFTHSVVARAQPARCDSCHTKSYCVSCHLKGN